TTHPLVLFDGECNLCNGAVQFVLRRDPRGRFRFASLQSEAGRAALRVAGMPEDAAGSEGRPPGSIVLIDAGRAFVKSAAALRIARGLRWPWPLLGAFAIVPPFLRDAVYDWIARHRYRWFGKRAEC